MPAAKYARVSRKVLFGVASAAIVAVGMSGAAEAKHKKFGIVLNIGVPTYGYAVDPYYSCHWLKRKAIRTGSPYWWKRYHYCVYG